MTTPDLKLWNRRWWKTPGESLWEDDIDGGRWRLTFDYDHNTWNLSLANIEDGGDKTIRFCWDYQTRSLIGEDRISSENVRHWVRDTCRARSGVLTLRDPRLLTAIADKLRERLWVSGKSLRVSLSWDKDEFDAHLAHAWPRLVVGREAQRGGDEYTVTLAGLMLLEDVEVWQRRTSAFITAALRVLKAEFKRNPDVDQVSPQRLLDEGVTPDELHLARHVLRIAALDVGTDPATLAVPLDIEDLASLTTPADFRVFIGKSSRVPRPWPTAPIVVWGNGPGKDEEMRDLPVAHLESVSASGPNRVVADTLPPIATDPSTPDRISIFWAWQSDFKTSRNQIEDALERVVEMANASWSPIAPVVLEQAVVLGDGAVHIDRSLLDKIRAAHFFVGDVTPVTLHEDNLLPNANVLIEVGYALASKQPTEVFLLENSPRTRQLRAASPGARFPFDIDHVHRIGYEEPAKLRERLAADLRARMHRLDLLRARGNVEGPLAAP